MKYISVARWPSDVGTMDGAPLTYDRHDTKEQAQGVCLLLEQNGWGGDGKIFPLKTWVEELPE